MAFKRPVHVSQKIIVPLSATLVIYATIAFTGVPELVMNNESRLFTTTRHEEVDASAVNRPSFVIIHANLLLDRGTLH